MMFKQLLNFAYQRNVKQAIGFYITYLSIAVVIAAVVQPIAAPSDISGEELLILLNEYREAEKDPDVTAVMSEQLQAYFDNMKTFSAIFSAIFGAVLAVLVAWKKKIFNEVRILGAVIVIIVIHYLAGPMLGLMPLAWLTTKESKASAEES